MDELLLACQTRQLIMCCHLPSGSVRQGPGEPAADRPGGLTGEGHGWAPGPLPQQGPLPRTPALCSMLDQRHGQWGR